MLLAAIPGQPNAYGALVFFKKIDSAFNSGSKKPFFEFLILSIFGPWDHRHVEDGSIWSRMR